MKSTVLIFLLAFSQFIFAQPAAAVISGVAKSGVITAGAKKIQVNLSPEELKLYNLINDYRKSKNLPAIPLSFSLTHVAQQHCIDLSKFRPANADSCNLHSWSANGKWSPVCYTPDHKNVDKVYIKPKELTDYQGYGYEIAYYHSGAANAENSIAGWKTSNGHNKMMINAQEWGVNWKAIGIGIHGKYATVWFGHDPDIHGKTVN